MRLLIAVFAVAALTTSASAELVERPYAEKAKGWEQQTTSLLETFALSDTQRDAIRSVAYGWFSLGPCQSPGDGSAIQAAGMISTSETPEFRAAYYAIIGQLSSLYFGRTPDTDLCQFVSEHS